jgi:hypothetical protein
MTEPTKYEAIPRRFSPDMKLRWLPVVDGKIIVGGKFPFSGFNTRKEAVEAAQSLAGNPKG